jgi:hypothetical protein
MTSLTLACLMPSSSVLNAASTPSAPGSWAVDAGAFFGAGAGVAVGAGVSARFVFVFRWRSVVVEEFEF